MQNGFITGSRVYGVPTEESDLDLVICAGHEVTDKLDEFSDHGPGASGGVVYGMLNIIALSPVEFQAWKEATEYLITIKPVSREQAKQTIKEYVDKAHHPDTLITPRG